MKKKEEKKPSEVKKDEINIYKEELSKPQSQYGDKVYFHKFRFKRNGHPITGIHVWIMGYGYYPVGHTLKSAQENFWFKVDKPFVDGEFRTEIENADDFVPFRSSKIVQPGLFYFVEGVQIRTALDYAVIYKKWQDLKKGEWLDFINLSNISAHPIINMSHKYKDADAQCITLNGKIYTGVITPLGSERKYEIYKGNLIGISESNYFKFGQTKFKDDKPQLIIDFQEEGKPVIKLNLEEIMKVSNEMSEQNDDLLLEEMVKKEEEETELIMEIANEELAEPLQDMQKTRDKLMPYNHNNTAIKIISFIDNTLGKIKEIIKS